MLKGLSGPPGLSMTKTFTRRWPTKWKQMGPSLTLAFTPSSAGPWTTLPLTAPCHQAQAKWIKETSAGSTTIKKGSALLRTADLVTFAGSARAVTLIFVHVKAHHEVAS